ncbi:MAG: GIY-YIG nuclease family protein [Planctomycetota bacterium]
MGIMQSFREKSSSLPRSGTYCLVLRVCQEAYVRYVGALGRMEYAAGYYCYAGSAMKHLPQRIERHFRRTGKRNHWHIDYFRSGARVRGAVVWRTEDNRECEVSAAVECDSAEAIKGFGASDCHCSTHLYRFDCSPMDRLSTCRPEGVEPVILS